MTSANLTVSTHNTPDELYAALARVFPERSHDGSRWVTVNADGVTLTFFGSRNPEAALTDESHDLAERVS